MEEESHRQFEIIYESLLLEGKVGNLTKSTLQVVLAQKPPAWLQVIHERLKHLIISSETFQNRRKMGYKVKRKIKLEEKNRLLEDKGQKGLQIMNSSHLWPKDKSTKNSIIGILNDWFCWQVEVLIVWILVHVFHFWIHFDVTKIEFAKLYTDWTRSIFHY